MGGMLFQLTILQQNKGAALLRQPLSSCTFCLVLKSRKRFLPVRVERFVYAIIPMYVQVLADVLWHDILKQNHCMLFQRPLP